MLDFLTLDKCIDNNRIYLYLALTLMTMERTLNFKL
jgi:hypothetical protein